MNYQKIYNQLVQKRRVEHVVGYKEIHHIVPKCMNGTNEKSNLVALTAREHYIAHMLLWKIYLGTKFEHYLLSSVTMMQCKNGINGRDFKFNSKLYGKIRLDFSKSCKNRWKNISSSDRELFREKMRQVAKRTTNGMLGKRLKDYMSQEEYERIHKQQGRAMKNLMYIVNLTTKETKRIPKSSDIPIGWKKGRYLTPQDNPRYKSDAINHYMYIKNVKTKERKRIKKSEPIPDGWEYGSAL